METQQRRINYLLLIGLVAGSVCLNVLIVRLLFFTLGLYATDCVLIGFPLLMFSYLLSGALILYRRGNRTIGWALVWSGIAGVLFTGLISYGITQLYAA